MWLALREYDNDNDKIGENATGLVVVVVGSDADDDNDYEDRGTEGESLVDGNQKNAFEEIVIDAGTHAMRCSRVATLHECTCPCVPYKSLMIIIIIIIIVIIMISIIMTLLRRINNNVDGNNNKNYIMIRIIIVIIIVMVVVIIIMV